MSTENKQGYQGFRMLTVVVPLNSHQETRGRQCNMKMHFLMRLLAYRVQSERTYYRMKAQNEKPLHHGALCLKFRRCFKLSALSEQKWLTSILEKIQEEELCSCIYMYDDNGEGDASLFCSSPIIPNVELPQSPVISAIPPEDRVCMDPAHVPYFMRQGLVLMANKQVEDINISDESYSEWFE